MAKVQIDIDVDEFRKQFKYLLDQASYDITEEQEGLLNLFGGIRDALEEQGIEVFPIHAAEASLNKDAVEKIADPRQRDAAIAQLWNELEDVPFDFNEESPDGMLAEDWAGFKAGTDRLVLWHWFDKNFSRGVHSLLFPSDHRFDFTDRWGDKVETYFEVTNYAHNGNLAIMLLSKNPDFDGLEPYGDLTRNIADLPPYCAAVDTNNLSPSIVDALEKEGIAHRFGEITSGFCTYPIMKFDPQALQRLHLSGAKEYAQLVGHDKALEKEGKDMSLADRAAGAKEMSAGLAQDTPERNFDKDAR